jgi:hypothetical protein
MIDKWLDPYELKARILPGLIIIFPILIDGLYIVPLLGSWPIFAAGGACGFALVYGLGHLARSLGEGIEAKLWSSWGGPPSTRFMRHRDRFFGKKLKRQVYDNLQKELSFRLASEEEEATNPLEADKEIEDAFKRVREYLRAKDPKGLWYPHNIEYGFSRNLLGCRWVWVIVALAAAAFAVAYGAKSGGRILNPASVMNVVALCCAIYVGWAVLPQATKRVADGYAEAAWLAFLRTSEESAKSTTSTASGVNQNGL